MKRIPLILLAVLVTTSVPAGEPALKNPFGVFNLAPFNEISAIVSTIHRRVCVMMLAIKFWHNRRRITHAAV